jgi:hypothetical protein
VLEAVIKYRWMALPQEQREGIKNYVATVVIKARARAYERSSANRFRFRHTFRCNAHLQRPARRLTRSRAPATLRPSHACSDVGRRGDVPARQGVHQQAEHNPRRRAQAGVAGALADIHR